MIGKNLELAQLATFYAAKFGGRISVSQLISELRFDGYKIRGNRADFEYALERSGAFVTVSRVGRGGAYRHVYSPFGRPNENESERVERVLTAVAKESVRKFPPPL